MRNILLAALLMVGDCSAIAQQGGGDAPRIYTHKFEVSVTKVIDGDSIQIAAGWVPQPLPPYVTIRLNGVDTPERPPHAKCRKEVELAAAALEYTTDAIRRADKVEVVLYKWDKYGGRILGDVFVDGQDLALNLIRLGYAVAYYGDAKQSWCN